MVLQKIWYGHPKSKLEMNALYTLECRFEQIILKEYQNYTGE